MKKIEKDIENTFEKSLENSPEKSFGFSPNLKQVLKAETPRLIFVGGKGGVGKTVISKALAEGLARQGNKTLWVTIEDPLRPEGSITPLGKNLFSLNCQANVAFEEYIGIKLGAASLTKIFVQNKLMKFLAEAAPGIHELVLLGKIWYERKNYRSIVVDLPSTGYGLAMFHSTKNFARLFPAGPVHTDAEAMNHTFGNPQESAHLIVSLAEEMPLQESLELKRFIEDLYPQQHCHLLANRILPPFSRSLTPQASVPHFKVPFSTDAAAFFQSRLQMEQANLQIWDRRSDVSEYSMIPFLPPVAASSGHNPFDQLCQNLSRRLFE